MRVTSWAAFFLRRIFRSNEKFVKPINFRLSEVEFLIDLNITLFTERNLSFVANRTEHGLGCISSSREQNIV